MNRDAAIRRAVILLVLLLAVWARFHLLDAQSFWNDEGNSARIAERSVALIVAGARGDIHPPGYYLLLAGWRGLAGHSEFALRALSAFAGVLLVAVVLRLGRAWFDWPAALFAGGLAALHGALVYYSQEARMYSLLGLWAALTFLLMTLWLKRTRRQSPLTRPVLALGALYAGVSAAGLYTHYAYPFALLAVNLAAVGGMAFHRRHLLRTRLSAWLSLNAAAVVLFAPWLPTAWYQVTNWPAGGAGLPWQGALVAMWRWLAVGPTVPDTPLPWLLLVGLLLVLLLGFWRGGQTIIPALGLLVPVGIVAALGLYSETFAKFLIVAVPFAVLLLGNGLAFVIGPVGKPLVAQRWPLLAAAAGLVIGVGGLSLQHLYFNPAYARADYRGIAASIQAMQGPNDAVLLNAPNQWEVFTYYYPDGPNVYPLARTRPLDEVTQRAELEAIVATHDTLHVLYWGDGQSDPARFVETWLNTNTFKAGDRWVGDVRLAQYSTPQPGHAPQPVSAKLGDAVVLEAYSTADAVSAPGDVVQLSLYWRATSPLQTRYKVFVHLAPAVGEPPIAQSDSEPVGGLWVTTDWPVGERVRDNHGIALPPGLVGGDYALTVGMYDLTTGARLESVTGDFIVLPPLHVAVP